MLITTDDLNQTDWNLFKYFDKLKEEFPDFKLLAFFTPIWKEDTLYVEKNDWGQEVIKSLTNPKRGEKIIKKEFLDFLLERKEWLSLGMHGLFHREPEFSQALPAQQTMFLLSAKIRNYLCKQGIDYQPVCKPPFYKFNETAFSLAPLFGFKKMYLQQGIIDFEERKFTMKEERKIIDSHVSIGCPMPDRIDKFYPTLRKILKGELKDKEEYHYTKKKE